MEQIKPEPTLGGFGVGGGPLLPRIIRKISTSPPPADLAPQVQMLLLLFFLADS